ncbi:MAG: RpiB/LacA/LacB family sugar-phosphate isomerase [Holosporales bacterium]|jgi:ribose 5-phosphate isomerase B|nr:RpiB/LacA/LacB family sugar-phosphate isomerase [Holosporales bacterium]
MIFNSIAVASDHRGYWHKKDIVEYFKQNGFYVADYGTDSDAISVDYPDYVKPVADHVLKHENTFGILICNSGIGMSIAANRIRGIRAALCYREEVVEQAREHTDANIICFGAAFISPEYAMRYIELFASIKFSEEYHVPRIKKIDKLR